MIGIRHLGRTRLAWVMVGFFGTQALQAYVMFGWLPEILTSAGATDTVAALYVSLLAVIGVVIAAVVPALMAHVKVVVVIVTMASCYLAGYLGLLFDPAGSTWLWTVLIGIGTGAFPVALTLIEHHQYRGRVLPGVKLDGISASGRNQVAVYDDVARIALSLEKAPLRVRVGTRLLSADPSLLDASVDG